jgi:hypothetical protein
MFRSKDNSIKISTDEHKKNIDFVFNEVGFSFFVLKIFYGFSGSWIWAYCQEKLLLTCILTMQHGCPMRTI